MLVSVILSAETSLKYANYIYLRPPKMTAICHGLDDDSGLGNQTITGSTAAHTTRANTQHTLPADRTGLHSHEQTTNLPQLQ